MSRSYYFLGIFIFFSLTASAADVGQSKNGLLPEEIISSDELKQSFDRGDSFVLFDARNKASFDSSHIQGATLPRSEEYYQQEELFKNGVVPKSPNQDQALKTATQKYPLETALVTYCNSNCHASASLAAQLKGFGFTHVRSMEEGIQVWEKKGYPVVRSSRGKS